jgi:outer membrane protein OmpA-like peptidoglycan-associated protein
MLSRVIKSANRVLLFALVAALPVVFCAQGAAQSSGNGSASKWDIFAGYSFLSPHGTITRNIQDTGVHSNVTPDATNESFSYTNVNYGFVGSVAWFFTKSFGVQIEGNIHNDGNEGTLLNDDFSGVAGGVIYRHPINNFTPFLHGLVGAETVGSTLTPNVWAPAVTAGGGVDYETGWFNHRLAIRLIQADYQYIHLSSANFSSGSAGVHAEASAPLTTSSINAAALSAGVVFHTGSFTPPPPVTLACAASPAVVYPGDPVSVTATANNLNPKLNSVYTLSGKGVTAKGSTATVDTAALAPGAYTVNCGVKEGKAGKEGLKPWEVATAAASFTVKQFDPPTISCSANPGTINVGDPSTVTANGVSPQNRPLTYSYTAAAGSISGNGATAAYASTGAAPGTVQITCSVSDDKGQSATANTSVTINAPVVVPSPEIKRLEAKLILHSVFFPTNLPTAKDPTGGLVASQEGTLTTLATDFKSYLTYKPDARLTLSGHTDVRGSVEFNQALSDRRVARTKQFLVENGVPDASIDVRGLGKEDELNADQVKELVAQNTELSDAERAKVLHKLNVIVLAQNRRVDITLNTTGEQSLRLYPFNAADSLTLLDLKTPVISKKPLTKKKAAAATK